jgi:arginase family enzyme
VPGQTTDEQHHRWPAVRPRVGPEAFFVGPVGYDRHLSGRRSEPAQELARQVGAHEHQQVALAQQASPLPPAVHAEQVVVDVQARLGERTQAHQERDGARGVVQEHGTVEVRRDRLDHGGEGALQVWPAPAEERAYRVGPALPAGEQDLTWWVRQQCRAAANTRCLVTLGGDNSVVLPPLEVLAARYGPLALLHFDAHTDTWGDDTPRLTHATVVRRAMEQGLIRRGHQIGVRGYGPSKEILRWGEENGLTCRNMEDIDELGITEVVQSILAQVTGAVYVSIDIDVLDPAYAPGTGTPEPGGLTSRELLYAATWSRCGTASPGAVPPR